MRSVMKKERKQCRPTSYASPLPPCKICGAKASGLHYGVNTCEACKGFFRRAVKFQKKYRCFQQQKCDVTGGRSIRTSCPFCRLQKCLNMGMAHNAIKTGRYTHAKRTENIMEVKRLENDLKKSDYFERKPSEITLNGMDLQLDHSVNGQFQMGKKSLSNHQGFDQQFWKIQIKQESQDDIKYFETCDHLQGQMFELSNVDVFTTSVVTTSSTTPWVTSSSICSQIHSDDFKTELTRVLICEIQTKLDSEIQMLSIKKEFFPVCQDFCYECPENNAIKYDASVVSPDTRVAMQETEPEGVYISIPTPPSSSCNSSEDSCFDFSSESIDQHHIVVISPENGEILSEKSHNSSLMINSSSFISPATTPSLDSVPSPSSSGALSPPLPVSDHIFPPSEYTASMHEEDSSPKKREIKLFSDLSKLVDQDVLFLVQILLNTQRQNFKSLAEYNHQFIQEMQWNFLEKHKARAEIFGLTSHYLKDETYREIFSQTGLDVDGRQEMLFKAGKYMGQYLHSIMKFAINIPGFTSLVPEDQCALMSAAVRCQWFLNAYFGINKRESIILMPNLQVYTATELGWLAGSSFVEKSFAIAPHFQKLDLPFEVLVVWKTVLLLSTDHVDLLAPEKVSELQNIYVNCLIKLTDRIKVERPGLFARLISHTLYLRELDHISWSPLLMDGKHFELFIKRQFLKAYT